ncbi:hypothetical protein VDG1235_303 [Verrucomicrobiia bacterium DG1235]|nr:hypothetical protein VDG1235_303 [Verrucomicrobiae bacterium DG1235]
MSESEQLAVVRPWLPQSDSHLQLIFEYDSSNPKHKDLSSERMHRAIDRAGPTVTIVHARAPYDPETRIIGGYNPRKWKSWLGRYELSAGRFIFDIEKNRKWERTEKRFGSMKVSPEDYGLSFGEGDLVIDADLQIGSARNNTFAAPSNASVIMGQAGSFSIASIRIYKVMSEELAHAPPAPLARSYAVHPSTPPHSVPDSSNLMVELAAVLGVIGTLRLLLARHS